MPAPTYVRLGYAESALVSVVDDIARTLCEADSASWAMVPLDERDRYRRLAEAVLREHAVFDPDDREEF